MSWQIERGMAECRSEAAWLLFFLAAWIDAGNEISFRFYGPFAACGGCVPTAIEEVSSTGQSRQITKGLNRVLEAAVELTKINNVAYGVAMVPLTPAGRLFFMPRAAKRKESIMCALMGIKTCRRRCSRRTSSGRPRELGAFLLSRAGARGETEVDGFANLALFYRHPV